MFLLCFFFQVGETYFIFVHGATADATGSFELSVTKRPIIDTCEGGTTLNALFAGQFNFNSTIDNTTTSTVMGTLMGASPDPGAPTCGDSNITSPGVWYTVFGTGGRLQALFNEFETDFNASVSVYQGSSCSSLECVELDVSSQYWVSIPGELYYILVSSADERSGDFGLLIDLGNGACEDVINPLPTNGSFVFGQVTGIGPTNASSTDGLPMCQEEPFSYPFVPSTGLVAWFSVVGTGAPLRFYSCVFTPMFSFPVYSGSCGNLTCVDTLILDVGGGGDGTGDDGYSYGGYSDGGYAPGSGYGGGRSLQGTGGYGGDPFCFAFVEWESVVNETYYIRAETPARNAGINVLEYVFQVEEQSP
jgi:hypothetical protein